ncbi:hypothetical protein MTR67_019004 [Solanum verrucosum]|uniref:Uncharacterized protein n=1 Tax=Solanum verrucosum TaxID=315347 RepID=A0AAF0QKQ4_SOLVR|nr:hypothetical protein MTR67_019004 [Solanum verrucosum]
MTIQIWEL